MILEHGDFYAQCQMAEDWLHADVVSTHHLSLKKGVALMDQSTPHPNWEIAISLLSSVLPGSTGYAPGKIAGHTPDDWQPFDLEDRDMDDVENDLLDRCAEMTGPLIVVNDTSFASYTFKRGPYFVESTGLLEFAKTFDKRVGSYLMDGHVIIVSPVTGIVVMVQDDGLIATVRGRPVMQMLS